MNQKQSQAIDFESQLRLDIASFYADPCGYVMYNFPWGVAGTPLEHEEGPDTWQEEELRELGQQVIEAEGAIAQGKDVSAIRRAISSGHGIGKTAKVAWAIKWFMATRINPQCIVTANTETQLQKKTWRELAKWNHLALDQHWFKWSATTFRYIERPETWFAVAQTWSENNPDAFQGTHEDNVLLIFDEASGIPNPIWESAEGAMTTPRCIWLAYGNMTRPTGRFVDCFGRFRHRWNTRRVDAREAKKANKELIKEWIEDYGEDSDFVRVRVKGERPRSGFTQFFGNDIVEAAQQRMVLEESYEHAPKVGGLDVARHGDDMSAMCMRRGLKLWRPVRFRIPDTMKIASAVANELDAAKEADDPYTAFFIDVTGIGWGVYDRLVQLGWESVCVAVQVGERADEPEKFFNKRAELYHRMKVWLKQGGDIPEDDDQLRDDLIGPEYGFDGKERLQIERKKDMKARGIPSPDIAESVIITFAESVSDLSMQYPRMVNDSGGTWMAQ